LSKFDSSPGPDHVRTIYFPETGDRPRLVWLRVLDHYIAAEHGSKLKVDCSSLDIAAKHVQHLREITTVDYNMLLRRKIPQMTWVGSFKYDGHVTRVQGDNNSSTAAIDKELPLTLFGPLLFYSLGSDLDATEFQNLVGKLRWRDNARLHIIGPTQDFKLPTVQSVLANCLGDMRICHQPDFAEYPLPAYALDSDNRALLNLPIGMLIGIAPVVIKSNRPGLPWRGRMIRDTDGTMLPPEMNRLLAIIHPRMYSVRPGSLIIARKDRRPLLKVHVMALRRYCQTIHDSTPLPTVRESEASKFEYDECFRKRWELLQAKATPEGFRAKWEEWKEEAKDNCKGGFMDVLSPYDM